MKRMETKDMNKYAYELMVKNNPQEAIKNLIMKDSDIEDLLEWKLILNIIKLP